MNDYLTSQMARDRQNEFVQQAKANRHFDQRMNTITKRVVKAPLIVLKSVVSTVRSTLVKLLSKQNAKPPVSQQDNLA